MRSQLVRVPTSSGTAKWLGLSSRIRDAVDVARRVLSRLVAPAARSRRLTVRVVETPALLSQQRQWTIATTLVGASIQHAEAAGRSHDAARQQVEAAQYALRELIGDLAGVMRLPEQAKLSVVPTAIAQEDPMFAPAKPVSTSIAA